MEAPRVRAMEFSPLGRLIFLGVNQLIYEKCTRSATNLLVPFLAIFFFTSTIREHSSTALQHGFQCSVSSCSNNNGTSRSRSNQGKAAAVLSEPEFPATCQDAYGFRTRPNRAGIVSPQLM